MRYLTHYEEYPIYEPAEGGYYYAGNEVVASERLSKRQAKIKMKRIWDEAKAENLEMYGMEEPDFSRDKYGDRIYPWYISNDGNKIFRMGYHIGEGESYVIERKYGSETRGWHPYC